MAIWDVLMEKCVLKKLDKNFTCKYVLMAIRPQFARLIREGKKTVELRRVAPKVNSGDVLVIYESAPICCVTAYAKIEKVACLEPMELWKSIGQFSLLEQREFEHYFSGKKLGNGIILRNVVELDVPRKLSVLAGRIAPQNYTYLSESEFRQLCL